VLAVILQLHNSSSFLVAGYRNYENADYFKRRKGQCPVRASGRGSAVFIEVLFIISRSHRNRKAKNGLSISESDVTFVTIGGVCTDIPPKKDLLLYLKD
jgi:hypothetical protein